MPTNRTELYRLRRGVQGRVKMGAKNHVHEQVGSQCHLQEFKIGKKLFLVLLSIVAEAEIPLLSMACLWGSWGGAEHPATDLYHYYWMPHAPSNLCNLQHHQHDIAFFITFYFLPLFHPIFNPGLVRLFS